MSHGPGSSGTPRAGHCSSAMTRVSCASSSASPTSRTILVRVAMIRGASIRQTVSTTRCGSVAVMATDPITLLLRLWSEVLRPVDLGDHRVALPAGPQVAVGLHETAGPLHHLLLGSDL